MKITKILIILLILNSISLFAKSGLELGFFVPLSMSIGVHYYNEPPSSFTKQQIDNYNKHITNNIRTSQAGFEAGVLFQAGYRLEFKRNMSFSFLGEFGYNRDTFNYRLKDSNTNSLSLKMKNYIYYSFDSIVIGILPKFNYKRFSIGIGTGIKIILAGTINNSAYNELIGYSSETLKIINTKNYKNYFSSNIIPYLKLTFDYSIYTSRKFDFVIGAYIGYDFALKYNDKSKGNNLIDNPIENISSVDIGFHIGTKIRPMN